MGQKLAGQVAFVTGAARGQGRNHALRLAQEGASIIAVDLCAQIDTVGYPLSTPEDLAETVRLVEEADGRILASVADVRDFDALDAAVAKGVEEFGRLDIVCANAGVSGGAPAEEISEQTWNDVIATNLTGTWHTAKAAIPHLKAGGRGGSIIITSSGAGLRGTANLAHYVASKHGVVGLMRTLAIELAPHWIRVNTINPSAVATPMILNERLYRLFCPELENPTLEDTLPRLGGINLLPVPWVEVDDISNVVVFLASEAGRYITGTTIPVDAGSQSK